MLTFPIDGGPALLVARTAAVAMLLLAFGTSLFAALVAPKALARASAGVALLIETRLQRAVKLALVAALVTMLVWLALQTADLAASVGALPAVLSGTTFGHVILAQAVAVVAALLALGRGPRWLVAVLAGVALTLQAGHSHALAMNGFGALLLSDVLHLLAAGAWLGGLPALLLVVMAAPADIGAAGARWFTPLGKACVVAMVATAAFQFWALVGGLPELIGTAYGWSAGLKMVLLALLLGFAVANRYRFAPALLRPERAEAAKTVLIGSIALQTGVGLLAVLTAATLSQLPPAIHEQPLWPFDNRPSLVAMSDPDLAGEVARALLLVAAAVTVAILGVAWRRVRWPAIVGALVLIWLAAPHFDLLLVEAYPTSYYHSPTGFTADAIDRGAQLFPANCAACHGADGAGHGPLAAGLSEPPADLTAPHLWEHADGELYWWVSHGIEAPDGSLAMPGFADRLSAADRWDLIDYIRAHNAGIGMRDSGAWPLPVQAPALDIACADNPAQTTADLRGSVLHLIAGATDAPAIQPEETIQPGVKMITVLLTSGARSMPPRPGACASIDPAAWSAVATVAGVSPQALSGTQFLVDADGWLRAEERPNETVLRWADPQALLADVRSICSHRVTASASNGHVHH